MALNQRLQHDIRYVIRMEPGVQTPEDHAGATPPARAATPAGCWCRLLRHLGLAARFVSGYLLQLTPDVKAVDGPVGAETDFTDLHAWCEVYLPGAGWIGLDPTSGLLAGEGHIPLACTPEPSGASPVSRGGGRVRGRPSSTICRCTRIYESPRVTKPYTEAQWMAVDCGRRRRRPDAGSRWTCA